MARMTSTDKWIVGGDGELRDLFVLPPLLKLTLDLLKKHPLICLLSLAAIPILIYTKDIPATLALLLLILVLRKLLKLSVHYVQIFWRKQQFVNMNRLSDSLIIPLDMNYHTKAALTLDRHVLIGGDSGTGKSNTVWQILDELQSFGLPHRNYVIDPAGGVELADLQHGRYTIRYTDRPSEADRLIVEFRDKMNDRLTKMKQHGLRKHIPTHEEPNYYLWIDELLLCTQQIKQGPQSPLGEVLAVGRKAGFIVVACTQLGQKTTLGDLRDMFPQRICFGTRSQEMTDAILGTGATRGGAPCHELTSPGEGYLFTLNERRYRKFKTPFIEDTISIANPINNKDTSLPVSPILDHVDNIANDTAVLPQEATRGKVALYKLFGENGILLYAGISTNPTKRFKQHEDKAWWDGVDFERTQILWYKSREEARQAEQHTIESEMPIYNIVHNN